MFKYYIYNTTKKTYVHAITDDELIQTKSKKEAKKIVSLPNARTFVSQCRLISSDELIIVRFKEEKNVI